MLIIDYKGPSSLETYRLCTLMHANWAEAWQDLLRQMDVYHHIHHTATILVRSHK